ncbi:MAG: hypothetical protein C5B54_08340 [Acidobacteria bacterium]|nr:MAG: hypothetical protein C5B54_08340 [Acidobacteriota bacterium]
MHASKFFPLPLLFLLSISFSANALEDQWLKKMSDKLASANAFTFSTTETHDGMSPSGKQINRSFSRTVLVRRPNRVYIRVDGKKDWNIWYDGKFITAVSETDKAYIEASMPATIDETLDEIADRWDMNMPMSDVLYSNPYESLISPETKGGPAGDEKIGGILCHHSAYQDAATKWEIWISDKDALPCKLKIVFEEQERKTVSVINFSNWNLSPKVSDQDFVAKIPDGYERIPVMERVHLVPRSELPQTQKSQK